MPTTSLRLLTPSALKYIGRSAIIPLQLGVVLLSTVTIAASEIPGPFGWVPRSPSTRSVTRWVAGTCTETVLVCALPLSGCNRYCIFTWQLVLVGFPSVRNSLKPAPARPSAKYQSLLTGPLAGWAGGVGPGDGVVDDAGTGACPEAYPRKKWQIKTPIL